MLRDEWGIAHIYAETQDDLRQQLLAVLESSGDPRLVNDGEFFETPPLAGPLPDDVNRPNRTRRRPRQ